MVDEERADTGSRSQNAFAISGEITDTGIIDFEQGFIMLNNFGNPFNEYIENGEGRRFVDKDRFSELILDLSTSKYGLSADKTKMSTIESID